MNIPRIITADGSLTFLLNGKAFTFKKTYPLYDKILDYINLGDVESLEKYSDISTTINLWGKNKIYLRDGNLFFNTKNTEVLLSQKIYGKILFLLQENKDSEYMFLFLLNLMQNPSEQSIKSLYDFLQYKELPLTDDGCFLAYKAVKNNYSDIYSGKFDNSIGAVPSVPRESVDSNNSNHCSTGLHVGAFSYVSDYGGLSRTFKIEENSEDLENKYCGNRVMIVKVNPKDAVSVPTDHNFQKLRVCKYEVIDELKDSSLVFNSSIVHVSNKVNQGE